MAGKLRAGNVHSAEDTVKFISPIVGWYRKRFKLFWLRGDAAFANPQIYKYCEKKPITYFIRLPGNRNLEKLVGPHLKRPTGHFPKSGARVKIVDFPYRAGTWNKDRRVVCKIEWHFEEIFPRVGFIATNSRVPSRKVVRVYNGRGDVENRIKEGKNTLRWDKTSCHQFEANEARLKMGVLAYNLLQIIREFYVWGEPVKRSIDWLIRRLIKVGARVTYHSRRWYVHVATAFPITTGRFLTGDDGR